MECCLFSFLFSSSHVDVTFFPEEFLFITFFGVVGAGGGGGC